MSALRIRGHLLVLSAPLLIGWARTEASGQRLSSLRLAGGSIP